MATIFLALIYLAFISLGLPDSVLGASWPAMRQTLGLPISGAGAVSVIITCGTVISSLLSARLLAKFGTGRVTVVSVFLTAGALLGIAYAPSFFWLCLLGIPLGLGAGSVDAGLNNYVALHYKASHMSWLHCFWGVGATVGPFIMSAALSQSGKWQNGYKAIGLIQFAVLALLLLSLPLWKKFEPIRPGIDKAEKQKASNPLKLPGAVFVLLSFFAYCALEASAGLWGASYLAEFKGLSLEAAAGFASAFYFGIMAGRLVCGFIALRVSAKRLIFIGQIVCIISGALLFLPIPASICGFLLVLLGAGCAPIYPSMLHETPRRFGTKNSGEIIGLQMACAYIGIAIVSPLTGILASVFSIAIYPAVLTFCAVMMLVTSSIAEKQISKAKN